jgi:hypothetical protein
MLERGTIDVVDAGKSIDRSPIDDHRIEAPKDISGAPSVIWQEGIWKQGEGSAGN